MAEPDDAAARRRRLFDELGDLAGGELDELEALAAELVRLREGRAPRIDREAIWATIERRLPRRAEGGQPPSAGPGSPGR